MTEALLHMEDERLSIPNFKSFAVFVWEVSHYNTYTGKNARHRNIFLNAYHNGGSNTSFAVPQVRCKELDTMKKIIERQKKSKCLLIIIIVRGG